MPDHNPYGEPLPSAYLPGSGHTVRVADRGPDPRRIVAETLALVGQWDHIDYSQIIADVALMRPDDTECALCGEPDCETGCPMTRWRGQA
jgi:hypothetical protein